MKGSNRKVKEADIKWRRKTNKVEKIQNKRVRAARNIKPQARQTGLTGITNIQKNPGVRLNTPGFLYDFNSRRLFKITKIVLPSCPMTPYGRSKTCRKFDEIKNIITVMEKMTFCLIIRFIRSES